MPSRPITLAIVLFWLGTTTWMGYRDLWPRVLPGEPPPFTIDLTDEVSARAITWNILKDGKRIGFAKTEVHRRPDRTFELRGVFRFEEFLLPFGLTCKKLISVYHVTADGEMRGFQAAVTLNGDVEVTLEGEVKDELFTPRLRMKPMAIPKDLLPAFQPVRVAREGSVLNPMHPLNKLTGLREGQHWRIPLVDPLAATLAALGFGQGVTLRYLDAQVSAATLSSGGAEVSCWRIDYAEPGRAVSARTWVRQSDGIVLQQEAHHEHLELLLQRELKK